MLTLSAAWIAGSSPAMTNTVAPKNHVRGARFQKNRAARKALIHRHKCKAFDFAAAMTITAPVSLSRRDVDR